MPEFASGSVHVARVVFSNPRQTGLSYEAVLWMGTNMFLMSEASFSLNADESKEVDFSVTMPTQEGAYPVGITVSSGGAVIAQYQSTSDVLIASYVGDIAFTVRIINAEILDQNALALYGLSVYSCAETAQDACIIGWEWVEGPGGEPFEMPIFWSSTDYAVYVNHMQTEHPGADIVSERSSSAGQWMPQVPDIVGDSYIRPPSWLGIGEIAILTVPLVGGGPGGGGYWNPTYPRVLLEVTGGPLIIGNQTWYGPLGSAYVELHQGALITFDFNTRLFTVS